MLLQLVYLQSIFIVYTCVSRNTTVCYKCTVLCAVFINATFFITVNGFIRKKINEIVLFHLRESKCRRKNHMHPRGHIRKYVVVSEDLYYRRMESLTGVSACNHNWGKSSLGAPKCRTPYIPYLNWKIRPTVRLDQFLCINFIVQIKHKAPAFH
jgi:hypothetical protein